MCVHIWCVYTICVYIYIYVYLHYVYLHYVYLSIYIYISYHILYMIYYIFVYMIFVCMCILIFHDMYVYIYIYDMYILLYIYKWISFKRVIWTHLFPFVLLWLESARFAAIVTCPEKRCPWPLGNADDGRPIASLLARECPGFAWNIAHRWFTH